jgi:hypothetical protein
MERTTIYRFPLTRAGTHVIGLLLLEFDNIPFEKSTSQSL